MATERMQRAYMSVDEKTGTLSVKVYNQTKTDDGKQSVFKTLTYNCTELPEEQQRIMLCKGVGAFMSTRFGAIEADEVTPEGVEEACDSVFEQIMDGTFTPGRAAESRPSVLMEALSEFLNQPVHVVVQTIKDNPKQYTPQLLGKMSREPAVAAICAKIEQQRAKDKAERAREAGKDKTRQGMDIRGLFGGLAAGEQAAAK